MKHWTPIPQRLILISMKCMPTQIYFEHYYRDNYIITCPNWAKCKLKVSTQHQEQISTNQRIILLRNLSPTLWPQVCLLLCRLEWYSKWNCMIYVIYLNQFQIYFKFLINSNQHNETTDFVNFEHADHTVWFWTTSQAT